MNWLTGGTGRSGTRERKEKRESPGRPANWLRSVWPAIALIVVATAAAYSNSLEGPFVFDDMSNIVGNASIRRLWPLRDAVFIRSAGETGLHSRPIVNITFAINYAMGGLNTLPYHLTNLAIHLLAGLTLFGIVRRTLALPGIPAYFGSRAMPLALAAALVWTLHPLQTQAVTFVTQRYESLMGLFFLAALYSLVRSGTSSQGRAWAAASVAAVTLALGCKEVAVSAPLILLLYDRAFLAGSVREAWGRRRGMYLGLLGAWFGFALLQSSSASRSAWAGYSLPVQWHEYARSQFGVILHYLRLSLWPRPLVLDYWWPVASGMREILPAAVVVGTLAAASVSALVRRPKLGFLGAWFFLILAPTSSIMPLSDLAVLHRMYLPLAAIVVLAVLGGQVLVDALVRRRWLGPRGAVAAAIGVVAAVATSLAFGTWQRNRDYAGTISIWRDTVANAPRNPWAHYNLGIALAERGFAEEAIWHLQKSVEIQPGFANAHYNLGIVLNSLGRVDEAIAQYRQVLEIQPDHAEARNNLGNSLDDRGQSEEAMAQYRQVLSIRPLYADAHYNLGLALARRGLTEAAIAEYRTTLAIQPGHAGALRELTSARPALQKR